jgi:hypothetical protein
MRKKISGFQVYHSNTSEISTIIKYRFSSCGIGVTNLGHCHNGVTRAVQKAAGELVHAQQNIMRHRPMVDLIDRLASLPFAQSSSLDSWFFWNSGAEAVEAAVKLARQVGRLSVALCILTFVDKQYRLRISKTSLPSISAIMAEHTGLWL